jgi:hypothetical protein
MNKPDLNRTQAIGLVLIFTALAAFFIPTAWVSAYMDTELVESYRGYEIHYLPNPSVYGVDIGGEVETWPFHGTLEAARDNIDLFVDGPEIIEDYRGGTIYKLPGHTIFWWEDEAQGLKTTTWDTLVNLKKYVDLEFFPNLVYTINSDLGDFLIYQQGHVAPRFWGELGDYSTPEYSNLADAKDAVRAYIVAQGKPEPTEGDETPGTPPADPGETDTGNSSGDDSTDTVGQQLATMKTLVAGVSGSIGLGLFVLGSTKRDD